MAAINMTARSSQGVRAEALTRFVADVVFPVAGGDKTPVTLATPVEMSDDGKAFFDRCRGLVADADDASSAGTIREFLEMIIPQLPKVLESNVADLEVESSFQIISSLIGYLGSADEANEVVAQLGSVLLRGNGRAAARLRILASLFSSCEAAVLKVRLFEQLLAFAESSGQLEVIQSSLEAAPGWFQTWPLTPAQLSALSLQVSNAWYAIGKPKQGFASLLRYLAAAPASPERDAAAVKAVTSFITQPAAAIEADLKLVKAVAALAESSSNKAAYALLQQFLRPSVAEFSAFAKANAAYLRSIGVDDAAAAETVKLLGLNDALAAAVDSRSSVSFTDITGSLGIAPSEVDAYVMKGVEAGLFEAQIDEVEQAVYPSRASELVFEEAQWEGLRDRLSGLAGHVGDLMAALRSEVAADDDDNE